MAGTRPKDPVPGTGWRENKWMSDFPHGTNIPLRVLVTVRCVPQLSRALRRDGNMLSQTPSLALLCSALLPYLTQQMQCNPLSPR